MRRFLTLVVAAAALACWASPGLESVQAQDNDSGVDAYPAENDWYDGYGYADDAYDDDDWYYDYYDNEWAYDDDYGYHDGYDDDEVGHYNWWGTYDDSGEEGLFDW